MKTAYRFDSEGVYIGSVKIYESPREVGVYPMPLNSTLLQPVAENDIFIDGAWEPQIVAITPEDVAAEKMLEVSSKFSLSVYGPFSVGDMTFDHGMGSILKIFLAIEKSKKNDETTRLIYESDETPHEMTLEDATAIAVAIGNDYDTKDALMRAYKKQITDIITSGLEDQSKVDSIDAITISYEVE